MPKTNPQVLEEAKRIVKQDQAKRERDQNTAETLPIILPDGSEIQVTHVIDRIFKHH